MNYSPELNNSLPDVQTARQKYKKGLFSDKSLIIKWVCFLSAIFLLLILSTVGLFVSCGNSVYAYNNTAKRLYNRSLDKEEITLTKKESKLNDEWKKAEKYVVKIIDKGVDSYLNGKLEYNKTSNMLNAFSKLSRAQEYCATKKETVDEVERGREFFAKAKDQKIQGDYISAIEGYLAVPKADKVNYAEANKKAKELIKSNRDGVSYAINGYLSRYDIQGAKDYVNGYIDKLGETDFLKSELDRIDEYEKFQTDTVLYKGDIEHVFTHCLIAYPELCYSSPSMTASLDEDCITPYEFTKIFEELYNKGYILIDINILAKEKEDGSVEIADLYLPKGKKPLVFSIDDVTYDSRKMHTGMVDKLIVDENGMVCTYTLHDDGTEVISYENEIFPIINDFVRKHPDFTFRGARGTLCNTGFDGVFGYRTQSEPLEGENVNRDAEIEAALKVAAALKEEGWSFASHSYGHANMPQCSFDYIKEDTDSWIEEVTAIIGETKVMVWPYGAHIRQGEAHDYLYDSGFRIFCGVGVPAFIAYEPDNKGIYMDRKSLDGYALRNRREKYMYLFDTEAVWDPLRPKEVTW
ncbi:MAG: hypothetical protein IKU52_07390 [Clostridia bacterium]|nr:hypothetical protein [Clostridia bacterium]